MLDKSFAPAEAEARLYKIWEESGAFAADPASSGQPFTIMIPPPNVTGSLHMGHALTFTVQDSLVRYRRMRGRDVLWQPGTDHAGIATQMVVERLLGTEGQTRKGVGRDAFLGRVWQWKTESGGTITGQLRRLGASLDWPRERFTMDEGLSRAVRRIFVQLHGKGLIYRAKRLVNWDPKFQSAISDLEVESREMDGSLWHFHYPIEGMEGRFITVATTRPETLPGDVAVAVNPADERYQDLIGKFAILPLVGRRIPIIADSYSDPTKGTGAVKITPAHDFNDFAVGERHSLPMPSVLNREAAFTLEEIADALRAVPGVADPAFLQAQAGADRFKLRAAIVTEMEALGLLDKIEKHRNQVPHGDRSGVPIEPLLTTQWFCDAATLAKPAVEAVEQGRTVFVPKQWENTFFAWLRDIEPWCISRQLWWGHRIPAWYGPDGAVFVAEDMAAAEAQARAHYGRDEALSQDEDVLDTWFSSGLWPFSTLGWPDQTTELARYYPTDVLVTGFDIIFFWVARMMMMGLFAMGEVPFKTVYIHGLVRDERGQKMSKSKGNVIDPLDLIGQFGTDALRFTICALTGPGRDVKLGPAVVESYRSFVTKLWNAARFLEMNNVRPVAGFDPAMAKLPLSRWILDAANRAVAEATVALEAYRLDDYASTCYRFAWNSFCDWFLEFAKPVFVQGETEEAAELRAVAADVFGTILRLLHPAIPYVTEVLWGEFGFGAEGTLIRAPWPEAAPVIEPEAAREELDWMVGLISELRAVRSEMRVPPSLLAPLLLKDAGERELGRAEAWIEAIRRMGRVSEVSLLTGEVPKGSAQAVLGAVTIVIPLEGLIDLDAERQRLAKERAKALDEAAKIQAKLGNESFVARAKPEVVQENRDRLAGFAAEAVRLEAALARLG